MKKKIITAIIFCLFLNILLFTYAENEVPARAQTIEYSTGKDVEKIEAILTGSEKDVTIETLYSIRIPKDADETIIPVMTGGSGVAVPVLVSAKTAESDSPADQTLRMEWYADKECRIMVDSTVSAPVLGIYLGYLKTPSKGMYYLKLVTSEKNKESFDLNGVVQLIPGGSRTIQNKETAYFSVEDKKPVYLKIAVKTTGVLSVQAENFDVSAQNKLKLILCDEKKKEISKTMTFNKKSGLYESNFALGRGTYYIKAVTESGQGYGCFEVTPEFTSQVDKGGKSLKTASQLKTSALYQGLLQLKETSSEWYKFSAKESKKAEINLQTSIAPFELKIEMIDNSGKAIPCTITSKTVSGRKQIIIISKSKLKKNTYYLKVTKKNSKVSGTYTISLK